MPSTGLALGLDVGGSSIKHALVDLETGQPCAELGSVTTPRPTLPEKLVDALASLAAQAPPGVPVGITLPSVIEHGVIHTAANLHPALLGFDVGTALRERLGHDVVLLNDGDAAGLAEVHFGAARGVRGTVMMLTFGTGIGSALVVDGHLWPNTELGHMEVDGVEGESRAAARNRTDENLSWDEWAVRVNRYLAEINRLFWPELIIIGGGVVENWQVFAPLLKSHAPLRRAALGPAAGVAGAALAASLATATGTV